ncbi:hypothetical protein [Clostridium formicaceticum]|uniref:Uncharacterized protein n=1 Tax=Clostridium formicaceticum TaxID=1497 RepID=A0AAC9RH56_9CLOT|nr:hypothetical protein [Clostridium formicaceticum]AOY76492.1 hypothetical protein BJL90_11865 [Clostridium formicaceticum]ARE86901.1 hypothetical protein CLFO_12850 [Clostridium formicaceticum]
MSLKLILGVLLKGGKLMDIMDINELMVMSLEGLKQTAMKKIKDLGKETAQDDLERIKDMFEELVFFWSLDESLIDEYDEMIRVEVQNNKVA